MNKRKNMHLSTKHAERLRIINLFFTASAVFCTLFGLIMTSSIAQAQGVPGGNITNAVISSVDIAEPAVVRIITSVPANLTVQFTATDSMTFPRGGGNYSLDLSGSGAFISAHGDIVTADHVVHPPQADMTNYLYQIAAQDITDYVNNTYTTNPPYDVNQIYNALTTGTFRSEPHYNTPKSLVYLNTAYTGPENAKNFKNINKNNYAPIDSIKKESPSDVQDLAIIHIAMDDTPSITLGDSTAISQQDELTIIGFPGNADITQQQDATQLLTSSVNKIYVSALKQNDDGTPLLQVSGNIEHGDSGGPALDSKGHLVGIVSFQKDSNGQPNNTSFLHVSQNIQQMVDTLKLDMTPGKFQQAWLQGFSDYASNHPGHWHKANQEFAKLASDYPNFNALKPFVAYTAQRAQQEHLPKPAPAKQTSPQFLPYLLGALGLLLLLIILGTVFMLNRKKSQPGSMAGIPAKAIMTTASSSITLANSSQWPPLPDSASPTLNQSPLEAAALPLASSRNQAVNAPIIPRSQPAATPVPTTPWDRSTPVPDPWAQPTSTSWNIPAPGSTTSNTGENRYDEHMNKQSGTFAREQVGLWSNADGTINAPPPPVSNPRYQQPLSHALDDENTGVRRAIQPEQLRRPPVPGAERTVIKQIPEQLSGPQIPIRMSKEPVDSRKNSSDGHAWPLPTAWQQAGILGNDAGKNDSVKIPQTPQNPAPGTRLNEYRNSKQQ